MEDAGRARADKRLISLTDGFEPASVDAWRAMAVRGLKGADFSSLCSRTADGIEVLPLYEAAENPPLAAPCSGNGWEIVTIADHTDPEPANRQILRDLDAGATCLCMAFEHAASAGGYGLPAREDALAGLMQGVILDLVHLRIEPHPLARRSAIWLADLFEKRSTQPARGTVSFGLDPIGNFGRWGALAADEETIAERLAVTAATLRERGFTGQFAEADGRSYHAAGATDGQELGIVLATAARYLRAFSDHGTEPDQAFSSIGVSLAAGQQQLVTIAKFRAMRLLWRRLQELCGDARPGLRLHAETARRMMMTADPHTNILRATLAAFAAGIGGADSIAILPHSWAIGLADRPARRIARNLHHLLLQESNVRRVTDPAAGSGAVDALTDGLCEAAWSEFQTIENEGGIFSSLAKGRVQARIAGSRGKLQQALASGDEVLVGATLFPDPDPAPVNTLEAERRRDPRFSDVVVTCEPVAPMELAHNMDGAR